MARRVNTVNNPSKALDLALHKHLLAAATPLMYDYIRQQVSQAVAQIKLPQDMPIPGVAESIAGKSTFNQPVADDSLMLSLNKRLSYLNSQVQILLDKFQQQFGNGAGEATNKEPHILPPIEELYNNLTTLENKIDILANYCRKI
jgi:hypothetical protein